MSTWNRLLQFARAHRGEFTLSVYIDAGPAAPAKRRSWMLQLRQQLEETQRQLAGCCTEEHAVFADCVERMFRALPAGGTMPRDQGMAYFTSASGDELTLAMPPGIETSVHWGLGPRVVPFLRFAAPEDALVVQVDRQAASITRLSDGHFGESTMLTAETVDELGPVMGAPPRQGFHSGTRGRAGADEIQRQRREATERLHAQVAKRVTALAPQDVPVVLGGAPNSATRVQELLPDALQPRTVLAPELRMGSAAQGLEAIREALHRWQAARLEQHVTELRDLAHAGGKATLGIEEARKAAEHGALAELIFSDAAWRRQPQEIEALVQLALAEGAEVAVAELASADPAEDSRMDGIVAGLRFRL